MHLFITRHSLTPSSLIKRLKLPCTGQFTLLPLKSSSRSGTHFQGSEKSGNIVFICFRWVPPWHFLHLCDPIETFDIISPPMPVQFPSLDLKSVCTVLVSDTFAYRSVPINKREDALTYPRVKSECQWKICSSRLISLHAICLSLPFFFSTRVRRCSADDFWPYFLCNANKLTTGFTIWLHSFDSNPNNILSSLFFQKNSSKRLLAQLRVKISSFIQREF